VPYRYRKGMVREMPRRTTSGITRCTMFQKRGVPLPAVAINDIAPPLHDTCANFISVSYGVQRVQNNRVLWLWLCYLKSVLALYYRPPPSIFFSGSYKGSMGFCILFAYPCPKSAIGKVSGRMLFPKSSRGNVALNVGSKLICCDNGTGYALAIGVSCIIIVNYGTWGMIYIP